MEYLSGRTNAQDFGFIPLGNLPLDSAHHALAGHGLLLALENRAVPRGYAYPRPGNAMQKREEAAHPGRSGSLNDR
jgi:hypothetical protein